MQSLKEGKEGQRAKVCVLQEVRKLGLQFRKYSRLMLLPHDTTPPYGHNTTLQTAQEARGGVVTK